MGVYLLIIACQDIIFRDHYNQHALQWTTSWCCQATGALAMTSCEVSVFILTYMSVERYLTIAFPFKSQKLRMRPRIVIMATLWVSGAAIALFPIVSSGILGNFYGTNGMCFPLHVHDPFAPGWQYSAFVFIGVNSVAMVTIMCCYAALFISIQSTRSKSQTTFTAVNDLTLARRFFVIVFTDALCWIPIIVIKILALVSVTISDDVYAWLAIFVLPVNSAINPVIYTLLRPSFNCHHRAFYTRSGSGGDKSGFFLHAMRTVRRHSSFLTDNMSLRTLTSRYASVPCVAVVQATDTTNTASVPCVAVGQATDNTNTASVPCVAVAQATDTTNTASMPCVAVVQATDTTNTASMPCVAVVQATDTTNTASMPCVAVVQATNTTNTASMPCVAVVQATDTTNTASMPCVAVVQATDTTNTASVPCVVQPTDYARDNLNTTDIR
ncbi:Relaxin receptor 1 [Lamellibrachia satsuma]|nr:Relaxin receptor 1 [Lamellibrachia satsuma]